MEKRIPGPTPAKPAMETTVPFSHVVSSLNLID
jgi:hypothetical protein